MEEHYRFDREDAIASILHLADYPGDKDVVFQADHCREMGLNTFDAFHAALADTAIISSDQALDDIDLKRIPLEPE